LIVDHFDTDLQLPDLDAYEFGKLDKLDTYPEPAPDAPDTNLSPVVTGVQDDLWKLDLTTPTKQASLRTWEAFANESHVESPTSYISMPFSLTTPMSFNPLSP
jgi:hypothetical protein